MMNPRFWPFGHVQYIYLFTVDKDTMVLDIELDEKCCQSHTTASFENIIYHGDYFNTKRKIILDVFDNLMQGIKNATNKGNPKSKPIAFVTIA